MLERVIDFARNIKIGNPLDGIYKLYSLCLFVCLFVCVDSVMMGPLTTKEGVVNYKRAIARSLELVRLLNNN